MNAKTSQISERFAAHWQSGSRPALATYLREADDSDLPEVARALLQVELQERLSRGEHPSSDEYVPLPSQLDGQWPELFAEAMSAAGGRPQSGDTSISMIATVCDKHPPPAPPTDVNERYFLRNELGHGYAGVVYVAWDEVLKREVAIKLPRLNVQRDEAWVAHFLNEAQLVAGLSHPGIVSVFDCGRRPDGSWFIVYELVAGGTLQGELKRGRPTVSRAVEIVSRLAEALQFAHQFGVYHRDLKPQNILISHQGRPKISDFGLAIEENVLSQHRNVVAGSPAYMSPEQVRGDTHLIDGRTDIWSLGVIFYEMLLGHRPFRSDDVSLLFELIKDKAPRPLRQVDPGIDKELERICLKCLQKSPTDRYLSAQDLLDDLVQWTQNVRPVVQPVVQPAAQRAPSHPPQVSWWVGGGVLVVCVLIGLFWPGLAQLISPAPISGPTAGADVSAKDSSDSGTSDEVTSSLLMRDAEAVVQPDDLRNTSWDRRGTHLAVATDHVLVLKFAESTASDFDLRLKYQQANWTGGIGVSWDGQFISGPSGSRLWSMQAVTSPPLMPTQKQRELRLSWRKMVLHRNGLQGPTEVWRDAVRPIPLAASCELLVQVRDHRLSAVHWNGEAATEFTNPPADLASKGPPGPGAIGLCFERTQVVVEEFTFHPLE